MKRLTILAVLLLTAACQSREEVPSGRVPALFGIEEEAPLTRSLLTSSGVETRKTGITLAAYRDGTLAEAAHFTTSLQAMPLQLEKDRAYTVYALVNMGDQTAALPQEESALPGFTYTLPGYTTAGSGVNVRGMPMAGSLRCTAGSGSTAIPVQRLLAKVLVDIDVSIPGASIGQVRAYNLNRSLKPFGVSAVTGADDLLAAQDVASGSGPGENRASDGTSGRFVLYVPENRQGNIGGIPSSREKNPDLHPGVQARLDRLSYLEVGVSLAGLYGGRVTYRSCLGNNATTNFDIQRNQQYHWQIHYLEDGLQYDDWKCDTGAMTDSRFLLFTQNPVLAEAGDAVSWSDILSTNLPLSGIGFSFASSGFASFTGSGFRLSDPPSGPSSLLTAQARNNPRSSLSATTEVRCIQKTAGWRDYEEELREGSPLKVFAAYQGDQVVAGVDYGYRWNGAFVPLAGLSGSEWRWTAEPAAGITSSAGTAGGKDIVTYAVGSTAAAGYYPIRVERTARAQGDDAFLHVRPLREESYRYFLSTTSTSRATPVSSCVISSSSYTYTYLYLIEHKVTKVRGEVTEDVFSRAVPFAETTWSFDPSIAQNQGSYTMAGAGGTLLYDDLVTVGSANAGARLFPATNDRQVPLKRRHGRTRIIASPTAHPEIQCPLEIRVDGYDFRYDLRPATAVIEVGETLQLCLYQLKDQYQGDDLVTVDGSGGTDVTAYAGFAQWSSSRPYTVNVSYSGLCTGVYSGTATITCSNQSSSGPLNGDYAADFTLSSTIDVGSGRVEVLYGFSPAAKTLFVGETYSGFRFLRTENHYDNYGDTVPASSIVTDITDENTYSTGNSAIAANSGITVTGLAPGSTTLLCRQHPEASATLTVIEAPQESYALFLSPESGRLKAGHTAKLTATLVHYTDGVETSRSTNPSGITWQSANTAVATVSGTGTVTGIAPGGPILITATWTGSGYSAQASATVEVLPPSGIGIENGWENDGSEINL